MTTATAVRRRREFGDVETLNVTVAGRLTTRDVARGDKVVSIPVLAVNDPKGRRLEFWLEGKSLDDKVMIKGKPLSLGSAFVFGTSLIVDARVAKEPDRLIGADGKQAMTKRNEPVEHYAAFFVKKGNENPVRSVNPAASAELVFGEDIG